MKTFLNFRDGQQFSADRLGALHKDLLRHISKEQYLAFQNEAAQERRTIRSLFGQNHLNQRQHGPECCEGAFRVLAAARSAANEEGFEDSRNTSFRNEDESSESALVSAQACESSVVDILRQMGEIIVNSEPQSPPGSPSKLRDDEVFEYFSEREILSLFVEIAQEKPSTKSDFRGVVWTAAVKAQVLRTVSLMVSSARDASTLYYILSQQTINQLVSDMLPLHQWTEPALDVILPAFVELLKNLVLQLGASPDLFALLTRQEKSETAFPLFSATLETATSSHCQSDSFLHATCLNLMVGLMQINHDSIEAWIRKAQEEQQVLANHMSQLLLHRYKRLANLTTGPVVDPIRAHAVSGQLAGLRDEIRVLNDLFLCHVRSFNVRVCEAILDLFVSVVVRDMLPPFLPVGVDDSDVIPRREARGHTAVLVMAQLMGHLEYDPMFRMLAVTLFHPQSSSLWLDTNREEKGDYNFTKTLNAMVQQGDGTEDKFIPNPFREEIMKSLRGEYGEWRVASAAMTVENTIVNDSLDEACLSTLQLLPSNKDPSTIEVALQSFLTRPHDYQSTVTTVALKCCASLVVKLVRLYSRTDASFSTKNIRNTLSETKEVFFRQLLESQKAVGVSDIFVDLLEDAVQSRYKLHRALRSHVFMLSQHDTSTYFTGHGILLRKMRSVDANDVEKCRFFAVMAIHFRAICRIVGRLAGESESESTGPSFAGQKKEELIDRADELATIFRCLQASVKTGTDIDLRGRMTFQCSSTIGQESKPSRDDVTRTRSVSEDLIFRPGASLILVLDPANAFVVAPRGQGNSERGSIVCCIQLLNIIAAAADGQSLHIAVQHYDINGLIQNGNMALYFPSAGTSLVVQRYLDRSRQVLRQALLERINDIFAASSDAKDCVETKPGVC